MASVGDINGRLVHCPKCGGTSIIAKSGTSGDDFSPNVLTLLVKCTECQFGMLFSLPMEKPSVESIDAAITMFEQATPEEMENAIQL